VVQGEGPEFKPQYYKKERTNERKLLPSTSASLYIVPTDACLLNVPHPLPATVVIDLYPPDQKLLRKLSTVVHSCNPSTQEAKAGAWAT
jgi:hypothetical protein